MLKCEVKICQRSRSTKVPRKIMFSLNPSFYFLNSVLERKKIKMGSLDISLVVQRLNFMPPMQGARVQPLGSGN